MGSSLNATDIRPGGLVQPLQKYSEEDLKRMKILEITFTSFYISVNRKQGNRNWQGLC